MPVEIERRFLVCNDDWRAMAGRGQPYRQSYLAHGAENTVRVRRAGGHATLTIKGPHNGCSRQEFEYRIPVSHAESILRHLCVTPIIEKVRYCVEHEGMTREIDAYCGEAAGLVLAEVELDRIDQPFAPPLWVGAEVTHDRRFRSAGIVQGLWRETKLTRAD